MPQQTTQGWSHIVAGASAGSAAVLCLHPFDVLKTRFQVQDGVRGAALPVYRNLFDAVRTILRQEGPKGFYAGLIPSLVGSGISWGAYFYAYESVKSFHLSWLQRDRLSPGWHLVCAGEAAAGVCLLTNPIWLVKTRMQLQSTRQVAVGAPGPPRYRGLLHALFTIGGQEGIRGLYKGLGPSLVLQCSHGAIQLSIYEELKYALMAAPPWWHWPRWPPKVSARGGPTAQDALAEDGAQGSCREADATTTGTLMSFSSFWSALWVSESEAPAPSQLETAAPELSTSYPTQAQNLGGSGSAKGSSPSGSMTWMSTTPPLSTSSTSKADVGGHHVALTSGAPATHGAPPSPSPLPPPSTRDLTPWELSLCGAMSKFVASVTTYPTQVVRSRLQQRFDGRALVYRNAFDVIRTTWLREGLGGFYKGLVPSLLRVMPQSAITFAVYEHLVKVLNTTRDM